MRQGSMFGGGPFSRTLGRKVPLRSFSLGQPTSIPPTCAATEKLVIKLVGTQQQWACEPLAGPDPAATPPETPAAASAASPAACTAPEGYGPLPTGGAAMDRAVYACPMPDGTFDVINIRSFAPVLQGVSRACLETFGDVTMLTVDDAVCKGTPQAAPTQDACQLPADTKFIMCPPSNGVTANYYLYADTGKYAPNMTTQPSECMNASNVIKVGANSPYCGGGEVRGAGSGLPQLVACFKQAGRTSWDEGLVDVHDGHDFSVLASGVMIKDMEARFPGQRYIIVTDLFCSALPDFGASEPPPAAGPAPAPAPAPSPERVLQPLPPPTPSPTPSPAPAPELPGGIIVIMPPPSPTPYPCDAGSWLRQRPVSLGQVRLRRGPF